ncbi:HAMP domain-containing histidine kinase [Candidatus Nomurabacteria bacterium]|nr:HAMP domain-containing histidine kinase [Candidatus Nomurabacteria bacterium]
METSIQGFINICQWDTAKYLIISNNVFGTLIYYSHFFALVLSLTIGIFVFFKDKKSLVNQLLFIITLLFSSWVFFDLILWSTEKLEYTMFFWSVIILIEPLIYALCVYFIDVYISKDDISLTKKFGIFIPLLPIIILLPTKFILHGFDLTNCNRDVSEGFISIYYVYIIEIIYAFWILLFVFKKYIKASKEMKKQIIFISLGIILFLLSFVSGNIIGSLTDNWNLAQIGLFGMPIFVGFLAYTIVKFKSFNIKMFAAQALVFALGFLVLAILFIRKIENVRVVVFFTLIFVIILGYLLIRSVKKEVKQREQLEILSEQLLVANDKLKELDKLKTEFISLATHQIRSPLTAIKGYASMILDGSYGEMTPKVKEAVDIIMQSSANLAITIEDFLNVSKIESGGMKYEKVNFDMGELANSMMKGIAVNAEKKGLKIAYTDDKTGPYIVNGDQEKLRQVVLNFIDNSIKYTKTGGVNVSVTRVGNKVHFAVKDTGMGMSPETKAKLFHKFSRGDGQRMNTTGSGLGLYLAKEIAKAHGGDVDVESEGEGKGSTFYMDLDATK